VNSLENCTCSRKQSSPQGSVSIRISLFFLLYTLGDAWKAEHKQHKVVSTKYNGKQGPKPHLEAVKNMCDYYIIFVM